MKNVKRNQGQWKRLTAILIVAVMLFTTPHIVGFASMSSEEAVTTSAGKTGMAEQGEEQNTGNKSVQTEEAGMQEISDQPTESRPSSDMPKKEETQPESDNAEEKAAEKTTEKQTEETSTKEEAETGNIEADPEQMTEEKSSSEEETLPEEESAEEADTSEESNIKEKKIFRYENDDVKVEVKESEAGIIADSAKLQIVPIEQDNKDTQKQYAEVKKQLLEKAQNEAYDIAGFLAYDIVFVDENGDKVEPDGKVQVSMEYKKRTMPEELKDSESTANTNVTVMHLEEDTSGKVKEVVDMSDSRQLKDITTTNKKVVKTVDFETESFSVFTITWTRTNSAKFSFSQDLYAVKPWNSSYVDLNTKVDTGKMTIETEDTNPVLYFSTISSDGVNKNLYKVKEDNTTYRFKGAYIATSTNNSYTLINPTEKVIKLTGRNENSSSVVTYQYSGDTSYRTLQSGQCVVMVYTNTALTTRTVYCQENGTQISNKSADLSGISTEKFDVRTASTPIESTFKVGRSTTYTYKYTVVGTGNNAVEIDYLRKYNEGLQYSIDGESWYDVGSETIKSIYSVNDGSKQTITTADTRGIIDIDLVNYQDSQSYNGLKFEGKGQWTGSAAVEQGIVSNTLVNGYPVFSGNKSGTSKGTSLKGLFDGTWKKTVSGSAAFGANHLFTYDSTTGKYKYDSATNYAYYDISSNNTEKNFIVYNQKKDKAEDNTSYVNGAFMPYSSWDDKTAQNMFAFGMRVGFDFTQPTGGQIKGQDMTFSFSGDDDVWIFIDGKLVLDMGGVHDIASGKINFKTGEVVINEGKSFQKKTSLKTIFGSVFADVTTHHLEMFYLERGRGASNCSLEFNIPPQQKDTLEIKKSLTNTDKEKYANVQFGFKAFLQDESTDGTSDSHYEAIPKETPFKVKKDGKLTGETRYVQEHNIFYLKSGESAVFEDIDSDLKFYAEEVNISSDEFDEVTIPNWQVSYVDKDGKEVESSDNVVSEGKKYIARSEKKIVGQNALVEFKNRCSAANRRELWITKKVSEDSGTVRDDETFSFKVWLEDKDGTLQPYSGTYYIVSTDTDRANYTTTDGVISSIKKNQSVVITQILSGTEFKVEEVNLDENKYAAYKKEVIEGTCAAGTIKDSDDKVISDGTIELKKDAKVEITNTKYHQFTVTKTWTDAAATSRSHEGIYVGLYDKEGKAIAGKYAQLNASNNWKYTFDKLAAVGKAKELREAQTGETADFEINGKGYVGVNVGDVIFNNGRYYVVKQEQISDTDNAQIVNEEITGSITIEKQKGDGTPLEGAEFKIEKKNDSGEYEQIGDPIETKKTTKTDENGQSVSVATAVFDDLEQGEYRITETRAPSGYSLLVNTITVNIPEEGAKQENSTNKKIYNYNGKTYYFNVTETVKNNKLFDMPEAGGGFCATLIGIAVMLIAGGWYTIRKRRRIV